MADFMDKYFTSDVEYPRGVSSNPLPLGEFWEYISSSFLDGFINYVNIRDAWCLNRYSAWTDTITVNCMATPNGYDWKDFTGTREEMFNLVTQPQRICHASFQKYFDDDVLILAKCKGEDGESKDMWMFFWFDSDCSDCCIGRFKTDDPESAVIKSFREWVNKSDNEWVAKQIPLHFFCGWLSS